MAFSHESIWISWNPSELAINDLALFASTIADAHREATEYIRTQQPHLLPPDQTIPYPRVLRIGMASPLSAEIAAYSDTGLGVLALGMLGYILRHPEAIGGWFSRARAASYKDRKDALEAKAAYIQTRATLEVSGRPVDEVEDQLREGQLRLDR